MPSHVLPRGIACAALLLVSSMTSACGRSDAETAAAVESQLEKDPLTAPLNLSIGVTDGVATLSGTTSSREEQARALQIAGEVVGVTEVVNAMEMDQDALLASDVKRALGSDPALASVPIEVDASNGLVRLMSDATNAEQRDRAVAVARSVEGVKDVEDRMK